MANDKDFKVKNNVQAKRYLEKLGTISSGSVTVGYDISKMTSSVSSQSNITALAGQEEFDTGNSGATIFAVSSADDAVHSYTMSTAYDLSTLSATGDSISVSSQENAPQGLDIKRDGTSFYIVGSGSDAVYQYDMTTPFDISTASYANKSMSVSSQDGVPKEVTFSHDGTKCYVGGAANQSIFQYNLSTAWDISTGSYSGNSFNVSSILNTPDSFDINDTGTIIIGVNAGTNKLHQLNLSTAYDISTASDSGTSFTFPSQRSQVKFSDNGAFVFSFGNPGDDYFSHTSSVALDTKTLNLSTGSTFNLTPTASCRVALSNPAASGTNSGATLLTTGFVGSSFDLANTVDDNVSLAITEGDLRSLTMSNSGTKLYIGSATNNSVYQYSLSTAYDATTATYDSVSFNHSSQTTNFQGLAFKPDGTKMFGSTSSNMYQYSLSTPFVVSSASYDSVSFNHGRSTAEMVFKPDGTRFFIVDSSSDDIRQFDLSSAWDLSTASYNNVLFDLSNQDSKPFGVAFNNDGTKMFILGDTNTSIFQYSLSTAWTVSSASYDSVSFNYGSSVEASVFFNDNGTKMFIAEEGGDEDIRRFTVGSAGAITYDSSIKFTGGTAFASPAIGETDVITFDTTDGGATYLASHAIDGAK